MADPDQANSDRHAGGRPLKYKSLAALNRAITAYFDSCHEHWEDQEQWVAKRTKDGKKILDAQGQEVQVKVTRKVRVAAQPYTVSGLARALGISRDTLLAYRERPEFVDSVEAAYARCHEFAESQLYVNSSGAAFSLKNNWGWEDKKAVDHTTKGQAMPLLGGTTPLLDEDDGEVEEAKG